MNETAIELPASLARGSARLQGSAVAVELAEGDDAVLTGAPDAFERALEKAGTRFRDRRPSAPGDDRHAERIAAEDRLDVPAVSAYQRRAIEREERISPAEAFRTGMGGEAYAYLRDIAGAPVVIDVAENHRAQATVRIEGVDGAVTGGAIDVVARPSSRIAVTISLDSPAIGAGLVGLSLRVFAGARSQVSITCVQTLDDSWVALDDTGLFLDEDARVSVHHTVLGAGRSYTGLAGDLLGDLSNISVATDYLGTGEQRRDFNYELIQRGEKTVSELAANGVLAGQSAKTMRGTIELAHGCKGSRGSERETVLLADERVRNKTVPVILCDEDDVFGNHGATIGHIRDEQLFYLATRGISPTAAEDLFIRAKLEDAVAGVADKRIRAGVVRLSCALIDDFEEEIA
ncbi:SufBD protein [Coriobacterium glomerans PW2]|uniref:SufBD protein n=2 Tax=Coriobacterium TaxID=33870 RepID=F2N858_CORGP|nr:SufBD protein [Coriobacterium glomerans PW2]